MRPKQRYKNKYDKIAANYHYKNTLSDRIFDVYSDEFFLFAHKWCVENGNKFITLTRFILPDLNASARDKLTDWVYLNPDLAALKEVVLKTKKESSDV